MSNAPPPAVIHRVERACAVDLGNLEPGDREAGAWTNSVAGPWNIIAHCYVRGGQTFTEIEQHAIPNPQYDTFRRPCTGHILLFDKSC